VEDIDAELDTDSAWEMIRENAQPESLGYYALKSISQGLTMDNENYYVRFEVFTAVTMKNCVFWDVRPCGSCKNRRFGGT
jgi:hypothetical protein